MFSLHAYQPLLTILTPKPGKSVLEKLSFSLSQNFFLVRTRKSNSNCPCFSISKLVKNKTEKAALSALTLFQAGGAIMARTIENGLPFPQDLG